MSDCAGSSIELGQSASTAAGSDGRSAAKQRAISGKPAREIDNFLGGFGPAIDEGSGNRNPLAPKAAQFFRNPRLLAISTGEPFQLDYSVIQNALHRSEVAIRPDH
jgi:hypothetical protein